MCLRIESKKTWSVHVCQRACVLERHVATLQQNEHTVNLELLPPAVGGSAYVARSQVRHSLAHYVKELPQRPNNYLL